MPMSEYMRGLRDKVGTAVIEVPTVSVVIFDERQRETSEVSEVLSLALQARDAR